MSGFRIDIPPNEPGEPKIPLYRIVFLIPGALVLGLGLWQAWRYFHLPASSSGASDQLRLGNILLTPKDVAGICAIAFVSAGGFFLWLAVMTERMLRKSDVARESSPMFVSARDFSLMAGLVGLLLLFAFLTGTPLLRNLPGSAVVLVWVAGAALLCRGILRLFRKRPNPEKKRHDYLKKNPKE